MAKNDKWMTYGIIILVIAVAAGAWLIYGNGLNANSPLGNMWNEAEAKRTGCAPDDNECRKAARQAGGPLYPFM